jgi:Sap-like sulfolipid-1-addressing protein
VKEIFALSLTAALNPTLLAATTLMLVLPSPKRLLLGYLAGALMTSITLGCVIVFAVGGQSSGTSTAKHTLNPILDITLGVLILIVTFVVATGRDQRRRARSARKKAAKADKAPPKWQQALSGGSARTTFVVGALLTLPGLSYLAGLGDIAKQDLATVPTVLLIVAFNLVMLMLLEIPLIGYTVAPEKTAATIERVRAWLARDGGRIALVAATLVGLALIGRGVGRIISG